ncbi:MAG: hypothetical protein F4X56_09385 [Gammaproteobacteria bacterium]|nr:hypothetical protein [Gammaproteobacteria bacterium]
MLDDFFVRAMIAGIGVACFAGPVGCFIVWRRLAYFGETIAHSSLLGVAMAIILDFNLVVGIFASASVVVTVLFFLDRRGGLPTDTILGLLAHGGLALGLVVLAFIPGMRLNLQTILFGDILAVTRFDLLQVWLGGVVALAVLLWLWQPLLVSTVSEDLARVESLRPDRAKFLFGILVAAIIAVAIKIVGVLLIVALLVIPAATARRFATTPEIMAVGATGVGVSSVIVGLFSSLQFDTPSGPSIVVAAITLFVITRLIALVLLRKKKYE